MRPAFTGGRSLADKAFDAITDKPIAKAPCCGDIFTSLDLHYVRDCKCGKVRKFSQYEAELASFALEAI